MFHTIQYYGYFLHLSIMGPSESGTVVRVQEPNGNKWPHDYGGKNALARAKREVREAIRRKNERRFY